MPCMKLTSASAGSRRGVPAVAGERVLLFCPGAPGCTIGVLGGAGVDWPEAIPAVKSKAAEIRQIENAMRNYTSWRFAASITSANGSHSMSSVHKTILD